MKKSAYIVFTAIIVIVFTSCSSLHSPNFARRIDAGANLKADNIDGLVISGKMESKKQCDNYGYMEFTLENKSNKVINISNVTIYFDSELENKNIDVAQEEEVFEWQGRMNGETQSSDETNRLVHSAVISTGEILSDSDNEDLRAVGSVLVIGGFISLLCTSKGPDDYIQYSDILPENHLLYDEICIYPGKHKKKWILLLVSDDVPDLYYINFELIMADGTVEKYRLNFRHPYNFNGKSPLNRAN